MTRSTFKILILALVGTCISASFSYGQGYTLTQKTGTQFFKRFPIPIFGRTIVQTKRLSESEIDRLAQLAKLPGQLGPEVGKLRLTEFERIDTFLRIAVKNNVLNSSQEAAVRKMSDVDGLASLLSKINSSNVSQVKGHLKELDIGIACQERGGKVIAFGKKFNDGVKKADTDLDILLQMNGKKYAIESKAYQMEVGTDMIRADSHSLKHFCSQIDNGAIPMFCFDNMPADLTQRVLNAENIRFLVGTGEEICIKLATLSL